MELSVIISYYKNWSNLELILLALNQQSEDGFEVIVSEDDWNPKTETQLKNIQPQLNYPLIHLHQQTDDGFRKNQMLNASIQVAKGEVLAFIDGDCIPHKHFVKAFKKQAEKGQILYGRRVMLGENFSQDLLKHKQVNRLSFPQILFSDSTLKKEALYVPNINLTFKQRGLLGCNWGIKKSDILAVNGFDEDYVKPGVGEDVDIEWRLKANGMQMKSMKNKAIVYHLYHPRSYSEDGVQANYQLMDQKQKAAKVFCENGLKKSD